ncbi:amidase, partial [Bacillus cereus]|nr:amidase [Bacillus cereus]MEC3421051.1 amidase [Bacillus cereus]
MEIQFNPILKKELTIQDIQNEMESGK